MSTNINQHPLTLATRQFENLRATHDYAANADHTVPTLFSVMRVEFGSFEPPVGQLVAVQAQPDWLLEIYTPSNLRNNSWHLISLPELEIPDQSWVVGDHITMDPNASLVLRGITRFRREARSTFKLGSAPMRLVSRDQVKNGLYIPTQSQNT